MKKDTRKRIDEAILKYARAQASRGALPPGTEWSHRAIVYHDCVQAMADLECAIDAHVAWAIEQDRKERGMGNSS